MNDFENFGRETVSICRDRFSAHAVDVAHTTLKTAAKTETTKSLMWTSAATLELLSRLNYREPFLVVMLASLYGTPTASKNGDGCVINRLVEATTSRPVEACSKLQNGNGKDAGSTPAASTNLSEWRNV